MPIDYSKFDHIGEDDEEEEQDARKKAGGGDDDFARLLNALQQYSNSGKEDPGDPLDPPNRFGGSGAEGRLGGGLLDPLDEEDGYGFNPGLAGNDLGSRSLDIAALRGEAWDLLLLRLLTRPRRSWAARWLRLEAEGHLHGGRYRAALVAALALQLALAPFGFGDAPVPAPCFAPALTVEMVSCYQLGDRDRAVWLREVLQAMDRSELSEHLEQRFTGTAEVLDLVPQFLSLLRSQEQDADAESAPAREADGNSGGWAWR